MAVQFYLTDDATLAVTLDFGTVAAGSISSAQTIHLWNAKGLAAATLANVRIVLLCEEPYGSGIYVETGSPVGDERHVQMQVSGDNAVGDPTMAAFSGGWFPIGGGVHGDVPDIPGNCARYLSFRVAPPIKTGTTDLQYRLKLRVYAGDSMVGPQMIPPRLGTGIVTHLGDLAFSGWIDTPAVTAGGTADVAVGARNHVFRGVEVHDGADTVTLNQNDGASSALTTGQEYQAVLGQPLGGGATVATKGVKAGAGLSVPPALPAGQLYDRTVTVRYHATSSVINQSDVVGTIYDGRLKVTAGTGLNVVVGAGGAVTPAGLYWATAGRIFAVPASSTKYLWLAPNGSLELSATLAPPTEGDDPLAEVTTDGAGVTAIVDLRRFLGSRWARVPGTEIDCGRAERFQVPPLTADTAFTAVRAQPGQIVQFILTTSGGTSYTASFGSGFSSVADLATGTTDGAVWLLEFRGNDAGELVEISRRGGGGGGGDASTLLGSTWANPPIIGYGSPNPINASRITSPTGTDSSAPTYTLAGASAAVLEITVDQAMTIASDAIASGSTVRVQLVLISDGTARNVTFDTATLKGATNFTTSGSAGDHYFLDVLFPGTVGYAVAQSQQGPF